MCYHYHNIKRLRKVKIDHYSQNIVVQNIKNKNNLKRYDRRENAECALCARRELAVNTLQQLLARCKSIMDAIKTLWECRVDVVGTL